MSSLGNFTLIKITNSDVCLILIELEAVDDILERGEKEQTLEGSVSCFVALPHPV